MKDRCRTFRGGKARQVKPRRAQHRAKVSRPVDDTADDSGKRPCYAVLGFLPGARTFQVRPELNRWDVEEMAARILVVEDDPVLLKILEAAIEYGGFESRSVGSGEKALAEFGAGSFDAILLDLGLPDYDGGELLKTLRSRSDLPIIVVSGRGTERDKIEALDLGADDFVPKPFLPGELLARIRAALRRYANGRQVSGAAPDPERSPMRLGRVVLDPFFRTIGCGGNETVLNEGEFKVLRLLATRADEIVSREEILGMLYGEEHPEATKIVEVYISNIRRKLREVTSGGELIANARGKGWVLRTPA